jgi:hypothetical protein
MPDFSGRHAVAPAVNNMSVVGGGEVIAPPDNTSSLGDHAVNSPINTPVLGATHAIIPSATDAADSASSFLSFVGAGTDHAGPANEAAFGGDQFSAVTGDLRAGGDAASVTNQLAHAPWALALGSSQLAGRMSDVAFAADNAAVSLAAGETDPGTLTNELQGGFTQTLLSSLLKVLTSGERGDASLQLSDNASPIGVVSPGTPVLDYSKHLTDSTIVDDLGTAHSGATYSTVQTAIANEQATSSVMLPTLISATFGSSGNDSFAFHPNIGSDTGQNTGTPTNELAHGSDQVGGPALGSTAPEFHTEFALDVIHQDDSHVAATVDQFHQMAANSTLLH